MIKIEKTTKEKTSQKKEKKKKTETKPKKQTGVFKGEKEYTLDLAKASQVSLSTILEYTKLGIKLKEIKKIKLVDKEDKKYIIWEPDTENEGDYIFTVLKSFKKIKLRIETKKDSKLIVLKNGAKSKKEEKKTGKDTSQNGKSESKKNNDSKKQKDSSDNVEKTDASTKDEGEEDKKTNVEEKKEEPAEPQPAEEKKEESAEPQPTEEKKEESAEPQPAEEKKEESAEPQPAEEKKEETAEPQPAEEKKEEPTEPQPAEEKKEEPAEPQPAEEKKEEPTEPQPVEEKKEEPTEQQPGEEEKEEPTEPQPVEEKREEPTEPQPVEEKREEPTEPQPAEEKKEESAEQQPGEEEKEEPTEQQPAPVEQSTGNESEADIVQAGDAEKQTEVYNTEDTPKTPDLPPVTEETDPVSEEDGIVIIDESSAATDDESMVPEDPSITADAVVDLNGAQGNADGDQSEQGVDGTGEGTTPEEEPPVQTESAMIPAEAEAWFKRGNELYWGTFAEIVGKVNAGETVNIQSNSILFIREAPLQLLSTVTLVPDSGVFNGNYAICISMDNPAIIAEPVLIQPVQLAGIGEKADLFVWVRQNLNPEDEAQDGDKPVITVTATGLAESGWSKTQPLFTLSGIPEGKEWTYVAIVYDERFVPISSNEYVPDAQGIYTLRFAMLDEIGDIMSASDQYSLQLDWTPPEVSIDSDEETSFKLNISATDEISGVDKVSVDAGKTWHKMTDGEYSVTKDKETTFSAGDIMVSDTAGNVYISEEEITVSEVEKEEEENGEGEGGESGSGGGGGGGGGGSGSGTPTLPHASGDGDEGADYDSLELDLPDEPMKQLMVGGEPLALTLMLESAQAPNAPVGDDQFFTAKMRHWDDAADDDALNTLVLSAEMDDDLGDAFTYEWRFNGEVYRLLANSGVKYVALQVGDTVAAFPTEGFTGGTKYTELKMQGVSTRKFDYTLAMRLNLNPSHVSATSENDYSQKCDLSIRAEVEDKNYELSNSPQSMMYFYNVFLGSEDMMDQPFGEYHAAA